jgi:trehalose 6-phosphate phosphatase
VTPAGPDRLAPLRDAPARAGILVDFDGTLAPIVDDADRATALPGAADALLALTERYALVAVVSGRPIEYLAGQLPDGLLLSGQYGLETRRGGRLERHPDATTWQSVIDAVAADAAELPELEVEHKGLSLTFHFRTHPEHARTALAWATDAAERSGLHLRRAKMSLELHPPLAVDKGTVVEDLAEGLGAVCYIGDDVGDVPAFDGLDRLAAQGVSTVRVAVTTSEAVPELLDRADVRVDGPEGVLDLLRGLVA